MKTTITSFLFLLLFFVFLSHQDGAFPENTGAPNELTCGRSPCHNIPSNIGQSTIQIDLDENGTAYMADTEHTVTISISNTNSSKHGFEILALDSNNENVGQWILTEPQNMQIIAGFGIPDRMYVTHTAAGNQLTEWTMNWKAPAEDVGDITFYTSVIAANNNGTNGGDSLYNTSKSITFEEMVSAEESPKYHELLVFPNPVQDVLFLENLPIESDFLQIFNAVGQLIFQKKTNKHQQQIDVSQWNKGLYFLKIGKDEVRKVLVL